VPEERLAGAAAWARIAHSQCSADGSEGLAALPHLRDALKLSISICTRRRRAD